MVGPIPVFTRDHSPQSGTRLGHVSLVLTAWRADFRNLNLPTVHSKTCSPQPSHCPGHASWSWKICGLPGTEKKSTAACATTQRPLSGCMWLGSMRAEQGRNTRLNILRSLVDSISLPVRKQGKSFRLCNDTSIFIVYSCLLALNHTYLTDFF